MDIDKEIIKEDKKRAERNNEFYNASDVGRAYKKHLDKFGIPPVTYSRGDPHDASLLHVYLKAIEDGVPYNEYNQMTPEERLYSY